MLSGVEYIDQTLGRVDAAPLFKTRYLGVYQALRAALPNAIAILRPASEGWDEGQIVDGFVQWRGVIDTDPLARLELSNEPNHPNERGADGWPDYEAQITAALQRIPASYRSRLLLPGLVPYNGTANWAAMLSRVANRFPGVGRAVHCYFEGSRHIALGVADAIAQCEGRTAGVYVTEFGDSGNQEDQEQRARNCAEAVRGLAAAGFAGAARFCAESVTGDWSHFVFTSEQSARIIAAGGSTPAPQPGGGTTMPDEDYALGQGFADEMARRGVTPASDQIDWNGPNGHHLGVAMDETGAVYYYTPRTGVVVHPKPQ